MTLASEQSPKTDLKLSIITITYNNYEDLLRTLVSIKPYDGKYEVVIINGGNCMRTLEYLEKQPLQNMVIVNESDNGISDAFNKGVQNATGDVVTFLNSGDTLVNNSFYEEGLKLLKNVDMVFGDIEYDYQGVGNLKRRVNRQNPLGNFNHQATLYKRDLALKELYSDAYPHSMDFDQILRCLKSGATWDYADSVGVRMQSHGKSHNELVATAWACLRSIYENSYYQFSTLTHGIWRLIKAVIRSSIPEAAILRLVKKNP